MMVSLRSPGATPVLALLFALLVVTPTAQTAVLPDRNYSGRLVHSRSDLTSSGTSGGLIHADLHPEIVHLLQKNLPEMQDIRIIDSPEGPRLDMPLSGCRDSLDCHHRFTNYLGLLVRMMETGRRK
ncbi:uncharacterized protein LOC143031634 [Oratosquilla oratoria]|uniref:uncharacterized protein LOC143031634 n=1 Tax=Oratosquilla oratoria TaxID=337810 RepID=UPI003F75F3E4